MIRLRLASFGDDKGDKQIPVVVGETLREAVNRVLLDVPLDREVGEVFHVLLNGNIVSSEFWDIIKVQDADNILVAPKIAEGDAGAALRTIAIIAATAVATKFLGPSAGATVGEYIAGSLAVAAVSIGTTALLNQVFPPAEQQISVGNSKAESQAYSITNQSNSVNKLGTVPKVYGTHRMFPLVAANPYLELKSTKANGEMEQWLYAIYDFGLGPAMISDLRIGDTPITEFSDIEYNLVDPNKPAVNEGPWDNATINSFEFYKGDKSPESIAYALNKDKVDGGNPDYYEVIRNSATNPDNLSQEIQLTFVAPRGLYSMNSDGATATRSIDIEVKFAKVGTENWKSYNDLTQVTNFKFVGEVGVTGDTKCNLLPAASIATPSVLRAPYQIIGIGTPWKYGSAWIRSVTYGIPGGGVVNYIVMATGNAAVGQYLQYNGAIIGKVISTTPYFVSGYTRYTLDRYITQDIPVGIDQQLSGSFTTWLPPTYSTTSNTEIIIRKLPLLGRARITANATLPYYSTLSFTPKVPGEYRIKVTRLDTTSKYVYRVSDNLTWVEMTTSFNRSPILTDKRHVFLELKMRATNQLNGAIQNLSAIVSSVIPVYDGANWVLQKNNNPAWVFCDLLTGEINKRPIDRSRLHLPSLLEWADRCDEVPTPPPTFEYGFPRFTCNYILDYQTTVKEEIARVCGAAAASMNLIDGKYGVLIDVEKTVPVQIFTPRNSWGFTSSRIFSVEPHAIRVKYVEPGIDWGVAERIVYNTGYTEANAEVFDEITTFACTNDEQAWRYGRYLLFVTRLRKETMVLNVDFEHLVCSRGDYVQITQDVMKVGGFPARVKTVSGNQITIDDGFETDILLNYGYTYRPSNGDPIYTSTLTVVSSDTFDLDGDIPAVGDLIIIGEVSTIAFDCLVKSITPNDDLSATITLMEKADEIHTAESTGTIPEYRPQISATASTQYVAPGPVTGLSITNNYWEAQL